MNTLQRYRRRPLSVFDSLEDRLNDMFDDFPTSGSNTPAVDVREHDDKYVVVADLPGMGEDDVSVTVDDNVLTISSSKEEDIEDTEHGYLRRERRRRSFQRRFALPSDADAHEAEADFKDGLLTLDIPRKEERKPKKIDLKKKKE